MFTDLIVNKIVVRLYDCKIPVLLGGQMRKSLTHGIVIVNNMKTQSLKLPLKSLLNEIVSSSICPPCMMLTVKSMVPVKIVNVPTRTCRNRVSRN